MKADILEALAHAAITLKQCAPERIPMLRSFIDLLLDKYLEAID